MHFVTKIAGDNEPGLFFVLKIMEPQKRNCNELMHSFYCSNTNNYLIH